jgi:hypothetical protein
MACTGSRCPSGSQRTIRLYQDFQPTCALLPSIFFYGCRVTRQPERKDLSSILWLFHCAGAQGPDPARGDLRVYSKGRELIARNKLIG